MATRVYKRKSTTSKDGTRRTKTVTYPRNGGSSLRRTNTVSHKQGGVRTTRSRVAGTNVTKITRTRHVGGLTQVFTQTTGSKKPKAVKTNSANKGSRPKTTAPKKYKAPTFWKPEKSKKSSWSLFGNSKKANDYKSYDVDEVEYMVEDGEVPLEAGGFKQFILGCLCALGAFIGWIVLAVGLVGAGFWALNWLLGKAV